MLYYVTDKNNHKPDKNGWHYFKDFHVNLKTFRIKCDYPINVLNTKTNEWDIAEMTVWGTNLLENLLEHNLYLRYTPINLDQTEIDSIKEPKENKVEYGPGAPRECFPGFRL